MGKKRPKRSTADLLFLLPIGQFLFLLFDYLFLAKIEIRNHG